MAESSQRNWGLDFLKFLATIFITNSHFVPLYPDNLKFLATFGVHGDALFYFTSGYLLMMGLEKRDEAFTFWFKKRIRRLWPASMIWVIIVAIVWSVPIDWKSIIFASRYWFIWCITIYYVLFYAITSFLKHTNGSYGNMKYFYLAAVIGALSIAPFLPWYVGSIYHSDFNSYCHFSIFILGSLLYINREKIGAGNIYLDCGMLLLSYIIYTIFTGMGKGHEGIHYYLQLLGYPALHFFCFYVYRIVSKPWTSYLFKSGGAKCFFMVLSSLTLEIYIVQWQLITTQFNRIFPLNLFIVFAIIVFAAYVLRVMVNAFLQLWTIEPFNLKEMFKLN